VKESSEEKGDILLLDGRALRGTFAGERTKPSELDSGIQDGSKTELKSGKKPLEKVS